MSEPAVFVYRGDNVEAVHHAVVVVIDAEENLTHYVGNPELVVVTRSSIKPFQLQPLLRTGAAERYGFDDRQLAVMCGSHNGSDEHREVVLSNLAAAGNGPELLQCGTHWPLGMQARLDYPRHGEELDPVRHNCSGKHSGFLALSRFLEEDPAKYLEPDSEVQRMVRSAVSEICDYDLESAVPCIDGCSAPNYALPLQQLARGYLRLATAPIDGAGAERHLGRTREAMYRFPQMVSGDRRFDLDLMRSFPHNVVCKVGAEALEAVAFRDPPIAFAAKIVDGNSRALAPLCIEIIRQLGLCDSPAAIPPLSVYVRPEVRNARNIVTGHVVPSFTLKRA